MMNYFSKFRYAIWTILILAIIIITAIITSIVFTERAKNPGEREGNFHSMRKMLQVELGLTHEQNVAFDSIQKDFKFHSHNLFRKIGDQRTLMMQELSKKNPDTSVLFSISDNLDQLHTQLKHEALHHMLRLRTICTEQQVQKLNIITMKMIEPERLKRNPEHHK